MNATRRVPVQPSVVQGPISRPPELVPAWVPAVRRGLGMSGQPPLVPRPVGGDDGDGFPDPRYGDVEVG